MSDPSTITMMRSSFLSLYKDIQSYRAGKPILIDGQSLSVASMVAVARYGIGPELDQSDGARERVRASRLVVERGVEMSKSIYGVTTGVGGSAGSRSDDVLTLGVSILQQIQCGILVHDADSELFPISHPLAATAMPESWVRGALLARMNTMMRGHSGVRWDVIEAMYKLLLANIVPMVPLRGSVSASGDLTPLSYIAGAIAGNPFIRVYTGPLGSRRVINAQEALSDADITPLVFQAKEPLSVVNGTSYSLSTGAIVCYEAAQLALLSLVCTALAVEGLNGNRASFEPFLHDVARPHPGQVEVAECIRHLLEGSKLCWGDSTDSQGPPRQDRYPLRTSPQYLGPQFEDIHAAIRSIDIECNSTTDNPLVDAATDTIHLGGNFQAMAMTNAMEKTRLALYHIGKTLFAQATELMNPQMNNGLPPSTAATNPSLDFHTKGLEVNMAAYVAELGFLANPVGTHAQSAEMHNESINSMALVSARATISAIECLVMLIAGDLYALCQAVDLRALLSEFFAGLKLLIIEECTKAFPKNVGSGSELRTLSLQANNAAVKAFNANTVLDAPDQMKAVGSACASAIVEYLASTSTVTTQANTAEVAAVTDGIASRGTTLLVSLREEFLSGARGPAPAAPYLGRTRGVYRFVRETLKIPMFGKDNLTRFDGSPFAKAPTIGDRVSIIYQAIMNGKLEGVVVDMLDN